MKSRLQVIEEQIDRETQKLRARQERLESRHQRQVQSLKEQLYGGSKTVRLLVSEERLEWWSKRLTHPPRYFLKWNRIEELSTKAGGTIIEKIGPCWVTFDHFPAAECFEEWQWSEVAQRAADLEIQREEIARKSAEQIGRAFAALNAGLISTQTVNDIVNKPVPGSFGVMLTRDATEVRRWIKFNANGGGHVDDTKNMAVFRKKREANRFAAWQKTSRRNGFGRNGQSGGRR